MDAGNTGAFSPDEQRALVGFFDGRVQLWQLDPPHLLQSYHHHQHMANSVAFSPDGRRIATSSGDGTVRLWYDGHCSAVLDGHGDWVGCLAVLPGGSGLASGAVDETVRLWL